MSNVEIDILEIKQILNDMKKNIAKIENNIRDSYFNEKIIEMQYGDDNVDDNYKLRMKIDKCMNALLETKKECKDSKIVQEYCDTALEALHKQYIELSLED